MKLTTVILLSAVVVLSSGFVTKQVRYADKEFLEKQKFLFDILQHVHQDDVYCHKLDEYKNYKIEDHLDSYNHPEHVTDFLDFYHAHYVSGEKYFSIFNQEHKTYAMGLAETLYFAKDFETFKKTAVWARFHMNKELFVYAMHVATLARSDMQGIVFPPIYEINPNYFFTAETIQKAQLNKMKGFHGMKKIEDTYNVAIPSNYTGMYGHLDHEKLISYYTEDIGLNAFYYYFSVDYPYWTKGKPEAPLSSDERGALYLYMHLQLLARYYMERLSLNLGEIEEFKWHGAHKLPVGYESGLRYYSGINFPVRPDDYKYYNDETYKSVDIAKIYDERIMESIDLGRFIKKDLSIKKFEHEWETLDILGNIIQGNADSINEKYYGNIDMEMRYIINDGEPCGTHKLPGPIMHFETSMRDPAFYQMYKMILKYMTRYQEHLPPYTEKELGFEGVKIENVDVDKMITYFEKYDSDITNAVDVESYDEAASSDMVKFGRISHYEGQTMLIKARQHRLNHMPFTVKVNINSNKAQKAIIKIFLAPKYDSYGNKLVPTVNRQNFLELEHFVTDLVPGKNIVIRNSDEFTYFVKDRTTYFELYKKLMMAIKGEQDYKFPLDMTEAHCGFPNRLMLPRGKKGGMTFQMFVFVRPYVQPETPQFKGFDPVVSCGIGSGARYLDDTTFGYPFDRPIDKQYWHLDNMHFHDVQIYHKTLAEVNAIQH